jgi:ATP-dependent DNA ligase
MKPIVLMGCSSDTDEATLKRIYNSPNWIAEHKFDGGRYQALVGNTEIRIFSRAVQVDRTGNVPHIVEEIKKLNLPPGTIIDGEIVHPTDFSQTSSIMNSDPPTAIGCQNKVGFEIGRAHV